MLSSSTSFFGILSAVLIVRAAPVTLDPTATAEAQQRDNTAVRAFTAVPIKTNDGQCLFVDPNSGDFRENLTPIQVKPCDGSAGQQWDVITSGKHNNVARAALIVSTLTNACFNFDPRRAAGNQVLLFSCGGRADGGGSVTNSQLFDFTAGETTFPLLPQNGQDKICLAPKGGSLDVSNCNGAAGASGNQIFTFGGAGAGGASPPAATTPSTSAPSTSTAPASSTTVPPASSKAAPPAASSTPPPAATAPPPGVTTGVKLNAAATAEAQQKDNTATRAFTGASIKTSDGLCLFVDPTSGDFRENLTPVQTKPCDNSPNQQWDVITSGKHNNVAGAALIVSSLTNACLNFDPRRAAGNQVLLFSCGGRADGTGSVTNSQLFDFTAGKTTFPLLPQNGDEKICLAPKGGLLDISNCNGAAGASGSQLFTIGGSSAAPAPASSARPVSSSTAALPSSTSATPVSTTSAAPVSSSSPSSTGTALPPGVTTGVKLDAAATAEAQQKDNTATRAFTAASIKTEDGLCLFVDPTSGDFRENLTPVQTRPCDGSPNQQWDVITAGKHNNVAGAALIVSSLTNACLNFDPRRAAGNQVLLFSCGGRADGSGAVTNSQLFEFTAGSKTIPLVPENGDEKFCLAPKNGLIDVSDCTGTDNHLFTIG